MTRRSPGEEVSMGKKSTHKVLGLSRHERLVATVGQEEGRPGDGPSGLRFGAESL